MSSIVFYYQMERGDQENHHLVVQVRQTTHRHVHEILFLVWKYQYRSCNHLIFENIQTLLTLLNPLEFNIFIQQFLYRGCNLFISSNKFSIIPHMPQGSSQLFHYRGRRYFYNNHNIGRVHQYSISSDHMTEHDT